MDEEGTPSAFLFYPPTSSQLGPRPALIDRYLLQGHHPRTRTPWGPLDRRCDQFPQKADRVVRQYGYGAGCSLQGSLRLSRPVPSSHAAQLLRQYLDDEHINKKKTPFDFTGWKDYNLPVSGLACSCAFRPYVPPAGHPTARERL